MTTQPSKYSALLSDTNGNVLDPEDYGGCFILHGVTYPIIWPSQIVDGMDIVSVVIDVEQNKIVEANLIVNVKAIPFHPHPENVGETKRTIDIEFSALVSTDKTQAAIGEKILKRMLKNNQG